MEAWMDVAGPTTGLGRVLRLGHGFHEGEREEVLRRLAGLDGRLRPFDDDGLELVVTVKERDTPSQRVILEAVIPHLPVMVATSRHHVIGQALAEVRDDLARQLHDAKVRREPAHARSHPVDVYH